MLRRLEVLAWLFAGLLVTIGGLSGVATHASQQARLAAFTRTSEPDQSDWSAIRIRSAEKARRTATDIPYGVIRIDEIGLEAEIFGGTDDRSLDLGAGLIEGTSKPGEAGNVGLAGHRDGYFRRLKNVRNGHLIEVQTRSGRWTYQVQRTRVVKPTDVEVLAPGDEPMLTLVTCYPFYFAGHAPERFIVHARLVKETIADNFPTPTATGKDDR